MTVKAPPGATETTGTTGAAGAGVGVGLDTGVVAGSMAFCTGGTTIAGAFEVAAAFDVAAALVEATAGAPYAGDEAEETGFLEAEPEIMTSKQVDHWSAPLYAQTQTIMWRPAAMFFGLNECQLAAFSQLWTTKLTG